MSNTFARFAADRSGATSIEYAVIAGFLSIAIATVVSELGEQVDSLFALVKAAFE